jgi:FkbM family methyltransferase
MMRLDSFIRNILELLGYRILSLSSYERKNADLKYLKTLHHFVSGKAVMEYKSQFGQDIFVLYQLNFKKNGFFIEFGATNGIAISNTYILEKEFGWRGILVEPAKIWHKSLRENRNSIIDERCVWLKSKQKIDFRETNSQELSTIESYSSLDMHEGDRKSGSIYQVETVSLMDLLTEHNAPLEIDYLSIDTEGSEFDILQNFDFNKYNIKIITVEHNFTKMREKIFELLTSFGYTRVFVEISDVDDWYIRSVFS